MKRLTSHYPADMSNQAPTVHAPKNQTDLVKNTHRFKFPSRVTYVNLLQHTRHCKSLDPIEECPACDACHMVCHDAWGQMGNKGCTVHCSCCRELDPGFEDLAPTSKGHSQLSVCRQGGKNDVTLWADSKHARDQQHNNMLG